MVYLRVLVSVLSPLLQILVVVPTSAPGLIVPVESLALVLCSTAAILQNWEMVLFQIPSVLLPVFPSILLALVPVL